MDPITRNAVDSWRSNKITRKNRRGDQQVFENRMRKVVGEAFVKAFKTLPPQMRSKLVDTVEVPNMKVKKKQEQKDNVSLVSGDSSGKLEKDEEDEELSDTDDLINEIEESLKKIIEDTNRLEEDKLIKALEKQLIKEKIAQLEQANIIAYKEDSFSDTSSSC